MFPGTPGFWAEYYGTRFPGGYVWSIEFNTTPGIFHTLTHHNFARPLLLGYDDPHFHLPILRWPEVFEMAGRAPEAVDDPALTLSPGLMVALLAPVACATSEREARRPGRGSRRQRPRRHPVRARPGDRSARVAGRHRPVDRGAGRGERQGLRLRPARRALRVPRGVTRVPARA
jgi:hypothetical protein